MSRSTNSRLFSLASNRTASTSLMRKSIGTMRAHIERRTAGDLDKSVPQGAQQAVLPFPAGCATFAFTSNSLVEVVEEGSNPVPNRLTDGDVRHCQPRIRPRRDGGAGAG